MSDGRWEAEERQRLEDKYLYMCQIAENSARELMERDKMLTGAFNRERELKDKIRNIAAIIHYQMPLKDQDEWLARIVKEGLYIPPNDEE